MHVLMQLLLSWLFLKEFVLLTQNFKDSQTHLTPKHCFITGQSIVNLVPKASSSISRNDFLNHTIP